MPEDRSLPSLLVELGDWADIATERVETGRLPLALEALQSVSTLAGRALALVEPPPVPVPVPVPVPPTPKPPTTDSFGGSYGYGHDPAFDLYPNGEDGPHFGTPLYCPVDGTVERYSIMVGANGWLQMTRHGDNGVGIVLNDADWFAHYSTRQALIAASPMFIAVMTPNAPVVVNGQRIVRFWFGHVQDGFATGQRKAKELLALTGNSGLASLPGEASHVHCAASSTGALSPNGDLPGILMAKWLGFNPRITRVPGPSDYATGKFFRGKLRGT
jgi:hypothetical protein